MKLLGVTAVLMSFGLVSVSVGACSPSASNPPATAGSSTGASAAASGGTTGGVTTVDVMTGAQDFTEEMIAEFEAANPDIKINLIVFDAARLNTMLASGDPPDTANGAAVGSANINARGLATDLTPYLEASTVLKESDLAPVNDGFRWDGTQSGQGPLYGIVKDWSQDNTLWYNTALFDQAGVPYLSETEAVTYDELLEIAKQLTVKEGDTTTVYGLGLEWAWSLYGPMAAMIVQQGGRVYNDDLSVIDLTSPEAQRAFAWYVAFAEAGVGPTSLNPLPDGSDFSTFAAGRMAITQDGYWFGGNFAGEDGLKTVRMAPAPVMGDTRASPTYGGQGWWIPEQADNKDAAWKVMEYYMAGPPAEARASSGWGMPGLETLMSKLPKELPYQEVAYNVAQNELQYAVPLPDSPYIATDVLNATLDKYLQAAIKKEMTVEEACAAATAEINEVLAQGKDQIGG
jgi:multiple sugar transport system substrate-binding protein